MYSLLMVGTLVLYLLVDDVVRLGRGGWARLVALALVSGLLLLTHYWSIWLLGSVELVLAWRWWRHPADRRAVRAGRSWPSRPAACSSCRGCRRSSIRRPTRVRRGPVVVRPTNLLGATIQDFGGRRLQRRHPRRRGHGRVGAPRPVRSRHRRRPHRARPAHPAVRAHRGGGGRRRRWPSGEPWGWSTARTYATRYSAGDLPAVRPAHGGRPGLLPLAEGAHRRCWRPSWRCACSARTGT